MLVKSYSISPVRLQRIVVKALFLRFCKVSIDHLFDNLESGKKIYCFGKSLEFWIQKSVRTLIILERVHSISTYFSVFVYMIPKRHFVHVQVIPESLCSFRFSIPMKFSFWYETSFWYHVKWKRTSFWIEIANRLVWGKWRMRIWSGARENALTYEFSTNFILERNSFRNESR